MEQFSSSALHPTSHLPPRLASGGTVLTKGLRLRPLVPSGAHPPAGHTASPSHPRPTASPLARSSSPRRRRRGRLGGDQRLRGLQLDPGSGRMVPRTRVGRSALRAAAPAGRGRSRAVQQALIVTGVASVALAKWFNAWLGEGLFWCLGPLERLAAFVPGIDEDPDRLGKVGDAGGSIPAPVSGIVERSGVLGRSCYHSSLVADGCSAWVGGGPARLRAP